MEAQQATSVNQGPTELGRLREVLDIQGDLINMLEKRLDPVSNRSPKPEDALRAPESPNAHISVFVDRVANNNRRLDQLIGELAI